MHDLFLNFATALGVGTLIGIEREARKGDQSDDSGVGGIRTFVLIAMAGAVAAWLSGYTSSPWIFAAGAVCVTAMVITGYLVQAQLRGPIGERNEKLERIRGLGLTTEIAAVVVYLLGGTALFGHRVPAAALGIVTAALLAYKQPIHGLVARIDRDDLYAVLKLLVASFVILPILPDRPVDPWGALNPYKIWWLVILISALSLVGYVATRWLGEHRGIALTGFFGGLVSSTAVTLTMARRSRGETGDATDQRDDEGAARPEPRGGSISADALTAGLLLAWGVMFVRVVVEVAIVNRALLRQVAWPIGAMGAVTVVFAGWSYWRGHRARQSTGHDSDVKLSNPFSLTSAMKFALLFAAVLLLVKLMQHYMPGQGLYVVAALAGLTDVDAITLSMAAYAKQGGSPQVSVGAITLATITNTLVKCGFVLALATGGLRWRTAAATVAILAAGGAAWWFA